MQMQISKQSLYTFSESQFRQTLFVLQYYFPLFSFLQKQLSTSFFPFLLYKLYTHLTTWLLPTICCSNRIFKSLFTFLHSRGNKTKSHGLNSHFCGATIARHFMCRCRNSLPWRHCYVQSRFFSNYFVEILANKKTISETLNTGLFL